MVNINCKFEMNLASWRLSERIFTRSREAAKNNLKDKH